MSVGAAYEALRQASVGNVRRDEPMARHTSFRIGGPADLFVTCDSVTGLSSTLRVLAEEEVPFTVLGKGTNVLVSDEGYRGAVVTLGRDFRAHRVEDGCLRCGAGVTLAAVVQDAYSKGIRGLEFAVGIPGTVGGALVMNAGTRDAWISGVVESVTVFVAGEGLRALRGHEVDWGYRRSSLGADMVVLECSLHAEEGDRSAIRREMERSFARRKETQPLATPSAGSVFKNPPGDSAGRLIESLGAKGLRIGGAAVSEKHANFIVNAGDATAWDVVRLIRAIQEAVGEAYGIWLETEIRFLGSFEA